MMFAWGVRCSEEGETSVGCSVSLSVVGNATQFAIGAEPDN